MSRADQYHGRWARRFAGAVLCVMVGLVLAACGDAQSRAMKELKKKGYSLELGDYFKAAGAGDVAALPLFLKAGIAADVRDGAGESALLHAIRAGQAKAAAFLLGEGAKLEGQKLGAGELLKAAILSKSEPTVELLLDRGLSVTGEPGGRAGLLSLAAGVGAGDIVRLLLPHLEEEKDAALAAAAASGDVTTVDVLLQANASVFHREPDTGDTALHRAAAAGQAEVVSFLFRSGANRYALNGAGESALEVAIRGGHEGVIAVLSGVPAVDEKEGGGKSKSVMMERAVIDLRSRILWQGRKLGELMTLRAVRQRRAPFALDSIAPGRAVFSRGGPGLNVQTLGAGDLLEGFVIEQFREHPANAGRQGEPAVVLRSRSSGHLVLALPGVVVRAGDLCALIELSGDDSQFEAHVGDRFTCISESEVVYRVAAVTPTEVRMEAEDAAQGVIALKTGSTGPR